MDPITKNTYAIGVVEALLLLHAPPSKLGESYPELV